MPSADSLLRGKFTMTVCNACRYCEEYCPVFPAMEQRRTFTKADLEYLAHLCHNCGECLYSCQFAPPHEYGINVPQAFAAIRLRSFEDYCWPAFLAGAFRRSGPLTALGLTVALTGVLFAATAILNPGALTAGVASANFYEVVPHGVMVALFGSVFMFVILAMAVAVLRFRKEVLSDVTSSPFSASFGVRDILTLRNLHSTGRDCVAAEEVRTPWRRRFHHFTLYGFLLCFASTTVAGVYHAFFGWEAPYGYTSAPVILGTVGGAGLLIGPAGQLVLRARRDPALTDDAGVGLDDAFIVLLMLTSLTGLILLVLRDDRMMPVLLIVHLGVVLALFVTLPYGKFVHGLYRAVALIKASREGALESRR
jgi:citrate/tricarballylate utilization protein